jgi:Tfp pilus assembly PilM family ATPase
MSRGSEINFVKSIPVGGRRFDELVAEAMSLSPHDAVQLRQRLLRQQVSESTSADAPPDENIRRAVLDAIRPALEQLSKEIALCVRYGSVTFRGPRADAITAIGGEAANADVLQVLTDQVRVPLHLGKPLRNITLETEIQGIDRRNGQPEWTTAIGLALKLRGNQTASRQPAPAAEVGA